jgi:hypothetical protein
MKKSVKPGKIIIPSGTLPEMHELETASILIGIGHDVEFLVPTYVKGVFSPDILMDGKVWEIKCPCGKARRIEENYRKAEKQANNIIFNLKRIQFDEHIAITMINREFNMRPGKVKRVLIILKNEKILDLKR